MSLKIIAIVAVVNILMSAKPVKYVINEVLSLL
jgi:hypothetical protein